MKPVNKIEFWKRRIDEAIERGMLHYSVYLANPTLWGYIEVSHRKIMAEHIKPGEKILDAGCGFGRMTEWVENEYIGVDFSPDFIAKAKELYPQHEFLVGDLKKLPFKDHQFDWAVCISIKTMIANNLGENEWLAMERELKRVAKQILILEYEQPEEYQIL